MSAPERPISVVLRDIVQNMQDIVRSEVRLAKTELREELAKTRSATVLLLIGALSALFSIAFVLWSLFYALSLVMPYWAAALCVAVMIGIVAGATINGGVKRVKAIHPTAPKTVANFKENVKWAKQQIK
jgi:uncharacterized membrane protein YqjE